MDLSSIENWFNQQGGESILVLKIFLVVFFTLVLNIIWRSFNRKICAQAKKTKNHWDDALIISLFNPVVIIIWGFGGWIIINNLFAYDLPPAITNVGVVFALSWFILRFIRETEINLGRSNADKVDEEKIDQSTIEAISKLLRVSVSITAGLAILQAMGVSISAVLAFGGIGGIAIGFAAKDLLANFFGGLMIYLDRPFSVGDWIRSPDRNIEGSVEYIGWRQTRIRTFDSRPLYVPNAIFNTITVENPSRMKNRRIFETIGIRYDDIGLMEGIVKEVKSMLQQHPDIDTSKTLIVNFDRFSDSSIDFFVYTFTKTVNWIEFHQVKQAVLLKVADIIGSNGGQIAYPTQRLQVEEIINKSADKSETTSS